MEQCKQNQQQQQQIKWWWGTWAWMTEAENLNKTATYNRIKPTKKLTSRIKVNTIRNYWRQIFIRWNWWHFQRWMAIIRFIAECCSTSIINIWQLIDHHLPKPDFCSGWLRQNVACNWKFHRLGFLTYYAQSLKKWFDITNNKRKSYKRPSIRWDKKCDGFIHVQGETGWIPGLGSNPII